ncbi:hypothetical protein ES703_32207 [subsurface metagenome]
MLSPINNKEEVGNEEKEHANSLHIVKLDTKAEPRPQNKYIRATLKGKDVAFERVTEEVEHRDPHNRCERVALMDGESALEKKTLRYLSGFKDLYFLSVVRGYNESQSTLARNNP